MHQVTGINAVIFYSNDIFKNGKEGEDAERAARIGTILNGVVSLISTVTAAFWLKYFGRKTMVIVG